ncbi:MAG: FKBP-type peptidyl-prolyl cis-trans isomerase [Ignavibacteria bacterium]|nr:FKBP-type peptidyl-prolyl cis-trans isomerase [Ignavibacteria bacterium]
MKDLFAYISLAFAATALIACDKQGASDDPVVMKTRADSASYMFGYQLGGQLRLSGVEVSQEALMAGYRDGAAEKKAAISDSAAMALSESLQKELSKNMEIDAATKAESMTKASDKFLAENKNKAGIITTASGLQYRVIKMGAGKKPNPTSNVVVHYTGKLVDGKVFDSSRERGEPVTFPANKVIPGWQEAILLMPQGSRFELFIPSSLAYGPKGAGNVIPGGAALIFEVELLEVK